MFGEADGEDDGAVDGANHFERSDIAGIARKLIAAMSAGEGLERAGFGESLEHLRKQRERDAIAIRDLLGAGCPAAAQRDVAESDQAVVSLLGELQHGLRTNLVLI